MEPLKKIIIVGNSSAAILTAAILAKNTREIEIQLLDGVKAEPATIAESSASNFNSLLSLLGISEQQFILNTQATFKLANQFHDWLKVGHCFNHSFGWYGNRILGADFNQVVTKLRQHNDVPGFDSFSVSAMAAGLGKLAFSNDYRAENLPPISHGVHFNLHSFLHFLSGYVLQLGVKRTKSLLSHAEVAGDGSIDRLITAQGETLYADFYIDCTGKDSLLLGKAMGVSYNDWSSLIKVDRCLIAASKFSEKKVNYSVTGIQPTPAGVLRQIPLRNGRGVELFYSSASLSDDRAREEFKLHADIKVDDASPILRLSPGRRDQQWRKNCLAIGDSFSNLGFDFYSSFSQVIDGIIRFLDYFPSNKAVQPMIDEYNRISLNELDKIRDYHLLHFFLLRKDHPLAFQQADVLPESFSYKVKLFKASGRLPWRDDEVINMNQWISLLLGMEHWPDRYDPSLDSVPVDVLTKSVAKLESAINELVSLMPSQKAYLSRLINNSK